jgi:prophage DNA circulation protein
MADSAKDAWTNVGERFSSWGRRLADQYKEAGAAETPQESQRKLEEAARELGDQLNRAFTAIGDTLRDEQAKRDLRDAVGAIGDAVAATVNEAQMAIRERLGQRGTSAPPERPDEPSERD